MSKKEDGVVFWCGDGLNMEDIMKKAEESSKSLDSSKPEVKSKAETGQDVKKRAGEGVKKVLNDYKNIGKNWKKVRASPYASLKLGIRLRQMIIFPLIAVLIYFTYGMVRGYKTTGFMGLITSAFTVGIMAYLCWAIYRTIPAAKRQLEYYKKNPHLINYCPADTKTTVNEILDNIEKNKQNEKLKEAAVKDGIIQKK